MPTSLKRILIGRPKATALVPHERLGKAVALAVFSSDALSSVAYATEEILFVLILAGTAGLSWASPIALLIGLLLVIVTISYRQTIHAYPTGGGAYIVAKENLGTYPGLIAGAALLIDYVLTVSVSIAAGVAAITSALPALYPSRVLLCTLGVALLTVANLRGVRESGRIFAVPTYIFIVSLLALIVTGFIKLLLGPELPTPGEAPPVAAARPLNLFLLLRAFASGCTALTGIEAISNGVPAFKPPESSNAATTMSWMSAILLILFLGITGLSSQYGILPKEGETVVSQLARAVFGMTPFYYLVQAATALILLLAANTSFADFPRLASLLARDGFLPRQLANRGDRLVFSNGILLLGTFSSFLLVLFGGSTHAIIPLYAVGVFTSFTLSQAGMVRHWLVKKGKGWREGMLIGGIGAATTGLVTLVIAATKFAHGAWLVLLFIPLLVFGLFRPIHDHYTSLAEQLRLKPFDFPETITHRVVVLIADVHKGVLPALRYARLLSPHVEAIHVAVDPEKAEQIRLKWVFWGEGIPLTVLDSPYRSLIEPILGYIDHLHQEDKDTFVTLIIPEFIPVKWWQHVLHSQTALWIEAAFLFKRRTVVVRVPYHLER